MSRKPKTRRASATGRRALAGKQANIIDILFRNEVTPNHNDDAAAGGSGVLTKKVRGWRVAESLERLREQINQMAPDRSKASDGSIGDAAHQTRDSDHNPWVTDGTIGVVTARDFTHDPKHGCDAEKIADLIVASKDKRVKYLIWNRRIVSSQVQPWKWRNYTGANPHNKHVHISVLPDKAKYDDRSDWQLSQASLAKLAMAFAAEAVDDIELAWGKKVSAPFKRKVIEIAAELGIDPNFLMAAMAFESMRTFSADIQQSKHPCDRSYSIHAKHCESVGNVDPSLAADDAG